MTDFEFKLNDRLNLIRDTITLYGANEFYISFSGGKDSVVLSKLIDMALPNNKIPRYFFNTGVEYPKMVKFVKDICSFDNRFNIIKPQQSCKNVCEQYGYPFASKRFSELKYKYDNGTFGKYDNLLVSDLPSYLNDFLFSEMDIPVSDKCCFFMKKELGYKIAKDLNCHFMITGMRRSEGGKRKNLPCLASFRDITSFNPLAPLDDSFIDDFVIRFGLKLCELYYPPYSFRRTGCVGCPFNCRLSQELFNLKVNDSVTYKIALYLWLPVYKLYKKYNIYGMRDFEL